MRKKFLCLTAMLLMLISALSFVGCGMFGDSTNGGSDGGGDGTVEQLQEYIPTADDDMEVIEGETYYKSNTTDLVTEINGYYRVDRPFTIDKENENRRIYHNIYFYEEDFFQIIHYKNINSLGTIYAILSDQTDVEYAEVSYSTGGTPLQIDIKKQGVYNLILDIETFAIDMVKVKDIQTPVYEKIKSCELNIHVSLSDHTYHPMTLNADTNEYYIEAQIPLNATIGFYSETRNSHYKMTVEENLKDTILYYNTTNVTQVRIHVGGTYKIYFNAKTYKLRLELQNPDTANYYCQVEWNNGNELNKKSESQPYIFEYEFVATEYADIPSFYPMLGMSYDLTVYGDEENVVNGEYVREAGTYKMTINLKDFTLTVQKIS
ncbi:MAG: hypothetical protein E7382_00030 [Clostridiales bacterium]|nr:hypothetical protein [Clostridiales bacterium]